MKDSVAEMFTGDLNQANDLMIEALKILDRQRHHAAAHLDLAIVKLGVRPDGMGMPPDICDHNTI